MTRMQVPAMWRGTSVQVCGLWPFAAVAVCSACGCGWGNPEQAMDAAVSAADTTIAARTLPLFIGRLTVGVTSKSARGD